jgi:hypothetical protein
MERKWVAVTLVSVIIILATIAIRLFVFGPGAHYIPGYRNTPLGPVTSMGPGMMYDSDYSTVGCPGMATCSPGPPPISQSDALGNLDNFSFRYGANGGSRISWHSATTTMPI